MNSSSLVFRPLPPPNSAPGSADALPIHQADRGPHQVLYAPGYLTLVDSTCFPAAHRALYTDPEDRHPALDALRRHALRARATWEERTRRPFEPVCLTLYLNNECSLACRYCFAQTHPGRQARLSADCVRAALPAVLENCRRRGVPLTAAFHGGGEPTHDPDHLESLLSLVNSAAQNTGIAAFRYLATHGALPRDLARRLLPQFDLIGLSCDGPPPLQEANRPARDGHPTSEAIERTAELTHAAGLPLRVRVTLTPRTVSQQPAIADYLCRRLAPAEIHVEPAYSRGRASATDTATTPQSGEFLSSFLEARRVARGHGVRWISSKVRLGEIHGPYCHLWRDVLQLIPGDAATVCFATNRSPGPLAAPTLLGRPQGARWSPEPARVESLRKALAQEPTRCLGCLVRYHCTRGCPEICPLQNPPASDRIPCDFSISIASALLAEQADKVAARLGEVRVLGEEVRHD